MVGLQRVRALRVRRGLQASPSGRLQLGAQQIVQPSREDPWMAEPVPAGSDVSSGTYKWTACGYELGVTSTKHLPPCPRCGNGHWETLTGDDSKNDPYPDRT
jgi:hypothetical protein